MKANFFERVKQNLGISDKYQIKSNLEYGTYDKAKSYLERLDQMNKRVILLSKRAKTGNIIFNRLSEDKQQQITFAKKALPDAQKRFNKQLLRFLEKEKQFPNEIRRLDAYKDIKNLAINHQKEFSILKSKNRVRNYGIER
ncbi:hypothetical protein [Francisella sp. XLW-1]|uniref:hypothetical protein n=1 Tax=Francisella sp. XLW-1 TaxID=2610887 RepID=UPI00123DCD29|nr:hypothetical protein [Francisella sp. XLW-1]